MKKQHWFWIIGGLAVIVLLVLVLGNKDKDKDKNGDSGENNYFRPSRPTSMANARALPAINKAMNRDVAINKFNAEAGLGIWGMHYGSLRDRRVCFDELDCNCWRNGEYAPCDKPYTIYGV